MKNGDVADGKPLIDVSIFHGPTHYNVFVPSQSTFGDLKKLISHKLNLKPSEQRLLFRGKEKDDDDELVASGVKNNSKIVLVEDLAIRENDGGEMSKLSEEFTEPVNEVSAMEAGVENSTHVTENNSAPSPEMLKAYEAITKVRTEVDKLDERVSALAVVVDSGTQVSEKEFDMSAELLMRQLLSLDGIEAEGDAKFQRKAEVRRVQKLVDYVDTLKARNSKQLNPDNSVTVTTQWEAFESGDVGLSSSPSQVQQPSPQVTQDRECFD